MSVIKGRLAKLEKVSRLKGGVNRVPGVSKEALAEARRVALICATWQEVAAFLSTLLPTEPRDVVPIDEKRRRDAVLGAAARSIMDEVHDDHPLRAG